MGARPPPRGRDRRLGAAHARGLPVLGPRGRRVGPRHRRGPRRRRPSLRRLRRGRSGPGRRRDPPLRAALAHDRGRARLPRPARCCSTTTSPPRSSSPPGTRRWCASARWGESRSPGCGRHVDLALADSEFSRRELEEAGFAADRRPPDLPGLRALPGAAEPGAPSASSTTSAPTSSSWGGSHRTSGRRTSSASPRSGSASSRRPCGSCVVGRLPASRDRPRAPPARALLRRPPGLRLRGGADPGGGALHRAHRPRRPARRATRRPTSSSR